VLTQADRTTARATATAGFGGFNMGSSLLY